MMKKWMSVILIGCMLLTTSVSLVSCAHTCEFSEDWFSDENSHWHECNDEECTEVANKADHTWNEGTITTNATQEADGVKTYTCSVCDATKNETVAYTGMTEDEWNAVFDVSNFENFTYTETALVKASGMEITTVNTNYYTKDRVKVAIEMAGQTNTETVSGTDAIAVRQSMIESILSLVDYEDYRFDSETRSYVMTGEISMESLATNLDTAIVKFKDGKISEIQYTCQYEESGITFEAESTITFTDYGTTQIS